MDVIDILSRVLYLVEVRKLSLDVSFRKTCKGRLCARKLEDRERIYEKAREFIENVIKLRCVYGDLSRKALARVFVEKGVGNRDTMDPWCRYSVPRWFYEELSGLLGSEVWALLGSLGRRVWWLRLNTIKAPEERIVRMLEDEAIIERDRDLWYLFRVTESKKPIRLLRAVKQGLAIPQDKASCLVVEALRPQAGVSILDMTAAPGIKTSLIVMLTEGRVRLVASDISRRRIVMMKNLLRDLGAMGHVDIILTDSAHIDYKQRFDKVLLDAPCSSSGSISKEPAVRLHLLRKSRVEYYVNIQRSLLSRAIELGSEVIYATCSLLPEEGEEVVRIFLDRIELRDPGIRASRGYGVYDIAPLVARTFPHIHDAQGFFISRVIADQRGTPI